MTATKSLIIVLLALGLSGCASTTPTPGAAGLPTWIPLPSGRIALPDLESCAYLVAAGSLCVDTGHAIDGTVHQDRGCIWLSLGMR
jgi:hypothetical protein